MPRPTRAATGLLVALAFWGAGYFYSGGMASSQAHYGTARALLEHGTFTLDRYPYIRVDVASFDGHVMSNKPPGFPLLLLPFASVGMAAEALWPGRRGTAIELGAHVTQALSLGTFGLLILLGLRALFLRVSPESPAALLAALAYLGTYLWPHSTTFFSHVATTALGLVAFLVVLDAHQRRMPMTVPRAAGVGFLLAYGVVIEFSVVWVFFPLGLLALKSVEGMRTRAALVLGAMVPMLGLMAYQATHFGGPFELTYGHVSGAAEKVGHARGFLGAQAPRPEIVWALLFSPYKGIFFNTPLMLAGVAGMVVLARQEAWRTPAALVGCASVMLVLFISGYWAWEGGSSFGPRFLVPLLPWLLWGLPWVWGRTRALVVVLAVAGFAAMLMGPAVCMVPHTEADGYWTVGYLARKLMNHQVPAWADQIHGEGLLPPDEKSPLGLAYNVGHVLGLRGAWSVVPFVVGVALLVGALWKNARLGRRPGRAP